MTEYKSNVAERFGVDKQIELFYIGDTFYGKSGTMMSSIYVADSKKRFDFGFVQCLLREGKEVKIRQATNEEMDWAVKELKKYEDGKV